MSWPKIKSRQFPAIVEFPFVATLEAAVVVVDDQHRHMPVVLVVFLPIAKGSCLAQA